MLFFYRKGFLGAQPVSMTRKNLDFLFMPLASFEGGGRGNTRDARHEERATAEFSEAAAAL